ncbi:polyphosphate polymerase domain-containing protein [Anaerotardibacter muris]|uniref:polyphosphate polymerase domain-containing protein n=1 Tax=Anaerotardibacter muris TaxID=2941505 RepID=UPI00203E7EA4|nr:polyphosphate polymerase domain-containing protein [Anaerotardibacter muris]
MTSYADVFKRKEMKYRLNAVQRASLESEIARHMELGEFAHSTIRSLYYDTPDFALIERSLDKPLYKEKLRLRTYGTPDLRAQAFVELKKKFKGVVYKRRVGPSLAAAQAFLAGMPYEQACATYPLASPEVQAQALCPRSLQIAREIAFTMERNANLEPSTLIECSRVAYADPEGGELRITFDADLACVPNAQTIDTAAARVPFFNEPISIMEVKNAGPLPAWLIDALDRAKAYPQSFSKYGYAYMNLLDHRKGDKCA